MDPAVVDPNRCENTDGNQWNYKEVRRVERAQILFLLTL